MIDLSLTNPSKFYKFNEIINDQWLNSKKIQDYTLKRKWQALQKLSKFYYCF